MDALNTENLFDDMLNSTYPEVEMLGVTMSPAAILYNTDRAAYNVAHNGFCDAQTKDGIWVEDDGDYYTREEWYSQHVTIEGMEFYIGELD